MLRQMTDAMGPLDPEALTKLEAETGTALPEEYRQFLRQYNGGRPEPSCFDIVWKGQPWAKRFPFDTVDYFFGVREGKPSDFLVNYRRFRKRVPADTVPIGCDPGGNLLLLGVQGAQSGQVFFWVREYEVEEGETPDFSNVGFVANSVAALLGSLREQ